MRRLSMLSLLIALTGCWADFPEERLKPLEARPELPDQQVGDLVKCKPATSISCTPDKKGIVRCTAVGAGTVIVNCAPNACLDTELRCDGCTPGEPSTCDADVMIGCNALGLPEMTRCSRGCANGGCL